MGVFQSHQQTEIENTMTDTPASLIRAYEAAEYHVWAQHQTLVLRIHQYQPELDLLLAQQNVSNGAFITAYNPQSQRVDDASNQLAHAQLETILITQARVYYPGAGIDPDGVWPPEPSFMILGLTQENARLLAKQFCQRALVWVAYGQAPQLIWL